MSNRDVRRRHFILKLGITASVIIIGLIFVTKLDIFTKISPGNFAKVMPKSKETIYDGV